MTARSGQLYCEMCGAPIAGRPYHAIVDGVEMVLCAGCYLKLSKSGRAKLVSQLRAEGKPPEERRGGRAAGAGAKRIDEYELVEDYAERVRSAREARGWTTAALAQRLRISEALLRKIEQGKVKPSVDLARRIESVLRVRLLERAEYEEEEAEPAEYHPTLGDIVVVRRDED